jgi:hypothetical protein
MDEDEQQLEAFIAKSKASQGDQAPANDNAAPTDEEQVERKARESGKPSAATVLQKKSLLSETALEKRISETLHKHPELDEQALRRRIATTLEAQNDELSEADYNRIVDQLLTNEQQRETQEQAPAITPPPLVTGGAQAAQQKLQQAADWASGLATPGGVGMLVFVLIFFIWVIVPVGANGKTRLQLLWGVLTGQMSLAPQYQQAEQQAAQGIQGAGADFSSQQPASGQPQLHTINFEDL